MLALWLLGCTEDEAVLACGGDLVVSPSSAVVTVVDASWTSAVDEPTRVEIHDAEGGLLATEWRDGENESATIVGVPAAADLEARVVSESGSTLATCAFETGGYPNDLPALALTGTPGWDGLLATSYVGATAVALVLDENGTIRWYMQEEPGLLYRTRFRADGKGVRYLWELTPAKGWEAYVADVDWHGGGFTSLSGDAHPTHDFATIDDGTIGMVTSYELPMDDEGGLPLTGNTITEVRPGGEIVEIWDALDDYYPDGVPPDADVASYWTHGNTIQLDPRQDAWWIGFRNRSSLAIVDRATGETTARMGDTFSDYTFGPRAAYSAQHAFQFIDGGILLHDNREDSAEESRVLELAIDHAAKTIEFVAQLKHDPPLWVYAMGEPYRLADGTTLVAWSSGGVIDDFAPDGTLRASLSAELGQGVGYIEYHETFPGQVELR
ncbi:MAG: aryl-sulfate sulfotransferase [Deltaproteobacteria bacterium]|nr:aryl-sulfate sulfotransferase [Deltaproteobacteria bacterium]